MTEDVYKRQVVQGRKLYMRPLPVEAFIPAVGQGIVGMECRASDRKTKELLAGINDVETCACGVAERTFLVRLGASCSTPVGACRVFCPAPPFPAHRGRGVPARLLPGSRHPIPDAPQAFQDG